VLAGFHMELENSALPCVLVNVAIIDQRNELANEIEGIEHPTRCILRISIKSTRCFHEYMCITSPPPPPTK
jgi:hypothetical protein